MKNGSTESNKYWKYFVLAVVAILITGAIIYLESLKAHPAGNENFSSIQDESGLYPKAPELSGIYGWINTAPFNMSSLHGKVVIVDFWTYSCINCLRTLPYLNAWYDKYQNQGLVIIGVHTPEFNFEKNYDNVAMAVNKYGVKYPVVLDNDYDTWNAYGNQYWPRKYIIDKNGYIRYDHIGEGGYDETETQIQQLLAEGTNNTLNASLGGLVNVTDETPDTSNTQELYLGYSFALTRAENVGNDGGLVPDVEKNYTIAGTLSDNIPYLEGFWKSTTDNVLTASNGTTSIYLKFSAKKAHVVVEGPIGAKVYVTIDNNTLNTEDVHDGYFTIDGPRLYTVYDGLYGTYTLKLSTNTTGVGFDSFTFS